MDKFEVTVLGCASATPSLRHMPSSQVVNVRETLYMLDCGEAAQLQARKFSVHTSKLRHIFISHLHGDHCLGLPGLLSTLALQQNGGEVVVHTFAEGVAMFKRIMDFFCRERTFDLKFEPIRPERAVVFENNALTIETVPLKHRLPTVGYIFREKPRPRHLIGDMVNYLQVPIAQRQAIKMGADFIKPDGTVVPNSHITTDPTPSRSYAYISDTAFHPPIVEAIEGVDVLYHEATYASDKAEKAKERFHSTAAQAAEIAKMANVGRLLIGHYSKSYNSEEQHLAEARAIFPNTIAVTEGTKIGW